MDTNFYEALEAKPFAFVLALAVFEACSAHEPVFEEPEPSPERPTLPAPVEVLS
jgi:hypothetical protein